jgi:PRTRC genetic system protein D
MYELAVDVGSGITKLCSAESKAHFPSLAGPPGVKGFDVSKTEHSLVSFSDPECGDNRKHDGEEQGYLSFSVGEVANNRVKPEELARTRNDSWYASNEYLALMYLAMSEGVPDKYRGKVRLCTGLPQALYTDHRQELLKRLIGTHSFRVDETPYKITIRKEDIFVMPQVMGLFLSRLAKDKKLQQEKVAVVDVGTYTSDWTIVENLGTVQWASGGLPIGVSNVVEEISRYLKDDQLAKGLTPVAVNKAVRTGSIRLKGRDLDLKSHIRQAVQEAAEPMVKALYEQWRGAADATVIVGGGGGRLFGPAIRTLIPHATVITDREPIFSVVEGYYSYLTAIRHQTAAA